jgi:hypothetical protein
MLSHSPRNVEPEPGSNDNIFLSFFCGLIQHLSDRMGHLLSDQRFHKKGFNSHCLGLFLGEIFAEADAKDRRQVWLDLHQLPGQHIAGYLRHDHIGNDQINLSGIALKSSNASRLLVLASTTYPKNESLV